MRNFINSISPFGMHETIFLAIVTKITKRILPALKPTIVLPRHNKVTEDDFLTKNRSTPPRITRTLFNIRVFFLSRIKFYLIIKITHFMRQSGLARSLINAFFKSKYKRKSLIRDDCLKRSRKAS